MNFQKSNLIHSTVLIFISLWMYFDALNKEFGLLIPILFGVVLMSLNNGIMYENKQQKTAAFFITGFSTIFLIYMMRFYYDHNNTEYMCYFGVMSLTSILSILVYIFTKRPKLQNNRL